MDEQRLLIGREEGDHVLIRIQGRDHPESGDFWDGNWLTARISVSAGAWKGAISASLRAEELAGMRGDLSELNRSLKGQVTFEPREPWLRLELTGDGLGHIEVKGTATDELATGNTLSFRFGLDQTELPAILDGLKGIESGYPVVGKF